MLTFEVRHGHDVMPLAREFAQFRLGEFRHFPYLYEGTEANELAYMEAYAGNVNTILVMILDDRLPVGMFTALPFLAKSFPTHAEVGRQLAGLGHDPAGMFYFGEAILRSEYRGRGLGRRACLMIEAYARLLGFSQGCMMTVERSAGDPRRPLDYQDPEPLFQALGFRKVGLKTVLSWPTLQADRSVEMRENTLVWWLKDL
jgi:GNAT superfamily N-acetyltransferase